MTGYPSSPWTWGLQADRGHLIPWGVQAPLTMTIHASYRLYVSENTWGKYMQHDESSPGYKGNPKVEVTQDMSTNWFILLAIFFPSVTGIFTGANMSGKAEYNPLKLEAA